MKVLGITGGVGSGKSTILAYLKDHYRAKVLICDDIAAMLQQPGGACYEPMRELLNRSADPLVKGGPDGNGDPSMKKLSGGGVLREDGRFDRKRVAELVFADPSLLQKLNAIVHPAVKEYVSRVIEEERRGGQTRLLVVEAALLLEDNYGALCDEIWFIYAGENVRRQRLRENRGYSEKKITQIMNAQRPEEFFREHCQFVVDNSADNVENTYGQIDEGLKKHGLL